MSKVICIIPARGGSKRIPHKNIKDFCGKPIIAWSIEMALASQLFDDVVVSSDCVDIISIAKEYGASTPFIRPDSISDDHSGTTAVVKHALSFLDPDKNKYSRVCCLYATAPFVTANSLADGANKLSLPGCLTSFSATSFAFPIQRAVKLKNQGVEAFFPENMNCRSQDLEEAYHDAGQFYWWTRQSLDSNADMFSETSTPVLLPRHLVQDIDTIEDWKMAEYLYQVQALKSSVNKVTKDISISKNDYRAAAPKNG
ncbi:pseudaminic acid cytidylyltransferase [Shewanella waksmanii]|uniref:pseudaminic acid cytidylyltransferase n=1 Tax=Shewanella waksmanii TaxID=213783 RepID=UPI0037351AAC